MKALKSGEKVPASGITAYSIRLRMLSNSESCTSKGAGFRSVNFVQPGSDTGLTRLACRSLFPRW